MKIEITTYSKPYTTYQEKSTMVLSIEDGMLFLGESSIDDIVDPKEILAAIEALLKWKEEH